MAVVAYERLTQKQEQFCLNVLSGMSQREAYLKAGYSTNMAIATIDRNACELAKNSKVLTRISELRSRAEDATVAGVIERKRVLSEIVRGRVNQYVSGSRIVVTPDQLNSAAVGEVQTSEVQLGRGDGATTVEVTRLKLRDPIAAISELNKMERIYDTTTSSTNNTQINIIVGSERGQQLLQRVLDGTRGTHEP